MENRGDEVLGVVPLLENYNLLAEPGSDVAIEYVSSSLWIFDTGFELEVKHTSPASAPPSA